MKKNSITWLTACKPVAKKEVKHKGHFITLANEEVWSVEAAVKWVDETVENGLPWERYSTGLHTHHSNVQMSTGGN